MVEENTPQSLYTEAKTRMDKAIEVLKNEFTNIRTGRASANVLDGVLVDYYGSKTPINQVASINTLDARTLEIKPWDASVLAEIEKAIQKENLGVNPMNDGKLIRIIFPSLTEERRKELVKQVHKKSEEIKIEVRNHRRKAIEALKNLKKEKLLGEDEERTQENNIQKLTDEYIAQIDQLSKVKEQELMAI